MDQQAFESALEACASEAIHQIGHIQPHGGLLVFSKDAEHQITQVSLNLAEFLGKAPDNVLNRPLAAVFDASAIAQIENLLLTLEDQPTAIGKLGLSSSSGDVELMLHAYRADEMFVLEMELDQGQHQETRLAELLLQTQQTMLRTESYFETQKYFDLLAHLVRSLTGYDSVMVYRFDAHWNGEIISQSRIEAAPSYLGMHFPASDIPAQARRLYTTNLVRVVADVNATPTPITPTINPTTGQALDLTYSALRSLSQVHIEYLRNIGVHASMVISLLQNGRLWGLIACHHLSSKPASMGLREAGVFLSRLISTRLSAIEAMEQRALTDRANLITSDLLRALPMSPVEDILLGLMPELQKLLDASGLIVVVEGDIHVHGETPSDRQISVLLSWLSETQQSGMLCSDFIGRDCPALAGETATMAGFLATPASAGMKNCIIWLRKEKARTINWAGKYEEGFVQNSAGNYRLTPRKSFEIWSESWSGRSAPWTLVETGVAAMLALALPESLSQKKKLEEAQALQCLAEAELRMHRNHLEELVAGRTLELSIAKEAAESASRAKSAFLSKVSHELRTPMNAIMGFTSLGLRRTEDAKLIDYLQKSKQSSERLLLIINDMIDISEIESERLSLHPAEFALSDVIDHVSQLLKPLAAEKNLALKFENFTPQESCLLLGDRDRFGQILLNLVGNAIKFTAEGSVTVRGHSVRENASHVTIRIEVQDSGTRISKDARSRLFTPFEQADNSQTRRHGGSGLGLAICRRLARMMNGDIGLESNDGTGNTFWFRVTLPAQPMTRIQNAP